MTLEDRTSDIDEDMMQEEDMASNSNKNSKNTVSDLNIKMEAVAITTKDENDSLENLQDNNLMNDEDQKVEEEEHKVGTASMNM